ncbi:hypothetical protein GN244_ATG11458 [Phytophthora infestans]|uniref:BED-type domain-containing protein n=1 Tax=Phytophthora infestans TaxID=4787 RepID=A0A833SPB5_PHYIN|nr:hypothetical protein GN244_ATG11458 [Phytophthora infestans]KAI9986733.1 hypothetical protein PInf_025690 [Phytophthora infestans]
MELPKRTGRPMHPLWAHFHRGEKRNRYHYHAYCSYCVARHGADRVPPTRGVSTDMLRHLESCTNCPRKVVDAVKDLCNGRERATHTKKSANTCSSTSNVDQELLLDAVASSAAPTIETSADDAAGTEDVSVSGKRTASEALTDETSLDTSGHAHKTKSGQNATEFLTISTKRGRTESRDPTEEDPLSRWRTNLLQMAVAAGIPLSAFHKREFQELLQVMSPIKLENYELISSVATPAFLEETAAKLADSQLDHVKEGSLNSTIKSGLTLSVTCWRTLDLQQLVAFTLVNSNGDAACVRVEDIAGHISRHSGGDNDATSPMSLLRPALLLPLANAIENVLQDLSDRNISVMGIVADSAIALSAAKRVCQSAQWRSLLVVPCMSALLTSLAGNVLTHEAYRDAVGQLVELAAYFSNAQLQTSLRVMSGDDDARIPLPTRDHWFSFVASLTKALHYSDAITALCQEEGDSSLPLTLRDLVLGNDGQLWRTLRELAVLLAPLREAYSLVFQSRPKVHVDDITEYDNDDECATTVHGGFTLAHVMYQLGRMSQQYAELAESTDMNASSNDDTTVVARRLHDVLDAMWQRYDLSTMVLAYVFDFHMDFERLDTSNEALQWKSVASYFQLYFQRWFHPSTVTSSKVESILNAYQLRHFPFDVDTTDCYTDVSSFYSFVSDSHPEICALCCRVYAVALACTDLRRVVGGIGFLPAVAQTTTRPHQVELLLHVGLATNLKRTSRTNSILPDLLQASRPEELLCSQLEWDLFASDWRDLLDHEFAVDELEQTQQLPGHDSQDDKRHDVPSLSLNQLFFEALPPLPAAVVVAPSPHDPSGAITQASVAL